MRCFSRIPRPLCRTSLHSPPAQRHPATAPPNCSAFDPRLATARPQAASQFFAKPKSDPSSFTNMLNFDKLYCFNQTPWARRDEMPGAGEGVLKWAKLSDQATAPTRGSAQAAGLDLYSAYDYVVPAQGKLLAKTDIQVAIPEGCYGRVAPRSGLAAKHFIDVGAGVIDSDYRGNVGVLLFNFGKEGFAVKAGERIAQLVCERILCPALEELPTLDSTERGAGGFGSTGR